MLVDDIPSGTNSVALEVPDEAALLGLGYSLDANGIPHVKIYENDEPYKGQLMAIGIAPMDRSKRLKRLLGAYHLCR